jgi:hypothetical protein
LGEPVDLATAPVAVDPQLLLGVGAQPLGELRGLRARLSQPSLALSVGGRPLLLGCRARLGEHRFGLGAGVAQHRRRPFLGEAERFGGGRLRTRGVEDLGTLALGVRANGLRLSARVGERLLGRLGRAASARRRAPSSVASASSRAPSICRVCSASRAATARSRASSSARSCENARPTSVLVNHWLTSSR